MDDDRRRIDPRRSEDTPPPRAHTILVDGEGYTLYTFTKDTRNRDDCASLAGCLYVWPALVSGKPTVGPGVKRRLVGTIAVPRVGRQVTYAGHPLYGYVGDSRPAETDNINIFQSDGYCPQSPHRGARSSNARRPAGARELYPGVVETLGLPVQAPEP